MPYRRWRGFAAYSTPDECHTRISALIHAMCIPNLASANVHLILEPTIVLGCQLAIGG